MPDNRYLGTSDGAELDRPGAWSLGRVPDHGDSVILPHDIVLSARSPLRIPAGGFMRLTFEGPGGGGQTTWRAGGASGGSSRPISIPLCWACGRPALTVAYVLMVEGRRVSVCSDCDAEAQILAADENSARWEQDTFRSLCAEWDHYREALLAKEYTVNSPALLDLLDRTRAALEGADTPTIREGI